MDENPYKAPESIGASLRRRRLRPTARAMAIFFGSVAAGFLIFGLMYVLGYLPPQPPRR